MESLPLAHSTHACVRPHALIDGRLIRQSSGTLVWIHVIDEYN
jgi:hypothetical protein